MRSKMKNKDKFTEWYKQQIESNPYDPPESVWNNIHNELDVDNVWQRISSHLQKDQRRELIPYLAAASAILLFFLFYPFQNNRTYNLAENEINKNFPKIEVNSEQGKTIFLDTEEDNAQGFISSTFNTINNEDSFSATVQIEERQDSEHTTVSNNLTKLNNRSSGLSAVHPRPMLASYKPNRPKKKNAQQEKEKFKPQFYAGVSGELG